MSDALQSALIQLVNFKEVGVVKPDGTVCWPLGPPEMGAILYRFDRESVLEMAKDAP